MNYQALATVSCATVMLIGSVALAGDKKSDNEKTEEAAAAKAELSVAPLDHIEYPDDRPEWIESGQANGIGRPSWIVVTPPCDTTEECEANLEVLVDAAIGAYIESYLNEQFGPSIEAGFEVDRSIIDESVITNAYTGTLMQGDAMMHEAAVELAFNDDINSKIRRAGRNAEVKRRLGAVGILSGGGIAMLLLGSTAIGALSRRSERKQAAKA